MIMRDVNYGWMIRYIHANVASFFFIFVYLHIGRGLYYGSYKSPRVLPWSIGVIILVLMMATAFLGYVLPYGQMSLWGATVITNMLSAIPWIGQDFVEFVLTPTTIDIDGYLYLSAILPTIGIINWKALRGRKELSAEGKAQLLKIDPSFLAMVVGFIDGDGYISVNRPDAARDNISVLLVISLDIRDKGLLEYIQNTLGIGRIQLYKTTVKHIFNRTDLQEVLFSLMAYHNIFFLTTVRRAQFNLAMYIFTSGITKFSLMPVSVPLSTLLTTLPSTALSFTQLSFFASWFIGFVMAEGSFLVKSNFDHCFQISQRTEMTLFQAIIRN